MLDNRTCVQEITAHRKKHDEAIHDVAFHPSQPFIASAGADALAKIFVWQHCRHSGETELTCYSELLFYESVHIKQIFDHHLIAKVELVQQG